MIKKINYILLVVAIILAYNCAALRGEKKTALPHEGAREQADIASLYLAAADLFPRFFNEKDLVGFYSQIDAYAKEHKLKLVSVTHKTSQENNYSLFNLKKTAFTISISGRYADFKNFIFRIENQRFIDSLDSLKISPVISSAGASGDVAAEIKYSLYSFVSLKNIKPGERTAIAGFSKIIPSPAALPAGKNIPADIFSADCFKSTAADKTGAVKKTAPDDGAAKTALASEETALKSAAAKAPARRESSQKLVYNGYYFDSKKGIKAFVEFNGRVNIVSAGSALGDSYTVTRLDESSVAAANREEPFDTLEAKLNEAN
ncbi:MAG TPA: hypothetical protein PK467_20380 [Candidatus Wallbacteria bacterium]|nr:hypothetical protein [Candidatus Wallbacteria bacterium]